MKGLDLGCRVEGVGFRLYSSPSIHLELPKLDSLDILDLNSRNRV